MSYQKLLKNHVLNELHRRRPRTVKKKYLLRALRGTKFFQARRGLDGAGWAGARGRRGLHGTNFPQACRGVGPVPMAWGRWAPRLGGVLGAAA